MPKIYLTEYPSIMDEWDYTRNSLDPNKLTHASNRKVWWNCINSHQWESTIKNRVAGRGCPYCSNKKILCGFNDLASTHPDLIKYLVEPSTALSVTYGSRKKLEWFCKKGHKYISTIGDRLLGNNCSYCSGKKILVGFNDLLHTDKWLVDLWDYDKNIVSPEEISRGSNKVVHLKCKLGHCWESTVNSMTNRGNSGCPYCSNQKVLVGFNDLQTTHPQLFNQLEDKSLIMTKGSDLKTKFTCVKGHSNMSYVYNRTDDGLDCPYCSNRVSRPEVKLYDLLSERGLSVVSQYSTKDFPFIPDLYIPELNLIIEYDGSYWHKDKIIDDMGKSMSVVEYGYNLVRIRESPLISLDYSHQNFRQIPLKYKRDLSTMDEDLINRILDI